MALTVLQTESIVIPFVSGFLTRCGMNTTASGSNPDLAGPITTALRALGYVPLSAAVPVDTDLQGITDEKTDLFLGVTQLYTLRACWGRWATEDQKISLAEHKFDQVSQQIQLAYKQLAADLLARYGFGRLRRTQPKIGAITRGNVWPNRPPPPLSCEPWPDGTTPPPLGPFPYGEGWGFNP